jgi:prevent-host-death family protein
MLTLTLSEARARLPEILDRVAAGEEVHITRHGTPVAAVIGHDRWMKTKRQETLATARELMRRLKTVERRPLEEFVPNPDWDVEAHIREIREGRDKDPWEGIISDDD